MNEPILSCGKNGDELCAVRKGEHGCPYYDNENCRFFIADSGWTHPTKRGELDSTAHNLIQVSQEYLDGELDDKTYRAIVMAFAFMAMNLSPKQAQSMIDAAKMDIVTQRLKNLNKEQEDDG